jgi:sugar phosphate isomerase/epimerase
VFTASTPEWTPAEAATTLAAQGWDGIEWRITDQADATPPGFWAGNRATWPMTGLESHLDEIATVTRDAGLAFSGIGGYARSDNHDDVERMMRATAALGAERVRIAMLPLSLGDYRDLFDSARRDLEWAARRAGEYGVQALVELHHDTITSSASAAFRLVDGLDPVNIGIIHDLGNLVIEGKETHESAFQLLGPYLAHVHVKNAVWIAGQPDADGIVSWHHDWAPLGSGQADVREYVAALVRHGYDGWITLEDFSTQLALADRTRDNLAFMKDALARALGPTP